MIWRWSRKTRKHLLKASPVDRLGLSGCVVQEARDADELIRDAPPGIARRVISHVRWRQDVVVPRPLSSRERAALDTLLTAEFDGSRELRLQAASVLAEGDGLVIDLVVDGNLPAAPVRKRAPVEASVHEGEETGGLILFVDRGRLSGLEYWWTGDEKPREFPPATAIGNPVVM